MAMIDYSALLILKDYAYGATSSIMFNTDTVSTESGYEKRNSNWLEPLHEFDISYAAKREEIAIYLKEFYAQHRGRAVAFKFKDWSDYKCPKIKGTINAGDGLSGMPFAELYKKYQVSTTFDATFRRINAIAKQTDELNVSPFKMYFNDIQKTDIIIDYDYGLIYFNYESQAVISSISNASNSIITTVGNHGFSTNDKIYISQVNNGDNKINNKLFTITKINDTSFYINASTVSFGSLSNGYASKYPQNKTVNVTWEGNFYSKVRFGEDKINISFDNYDIFGVPTKLVELR